FGRFLVAEPTRATRSLCAAASFYVRRFHHASTSEAHFVTFRSGSVRVYQDASEIWDSSGSRSHDDPVRMLDVFHGHLTKTKERGRISDILDVFIDQEVPAVIFRRILSAAQNNDVLLTEAHTLLTSAFIFECPDTTVEAGDLLKAYYGGFA